MTSANVSSLPIQVGPIVQSSAKSEKIDSGNNFLNLMNQSMNKSVNSISYNTQASSNKMTQIQSQATSVKVENSQNDIAKGESGQTVVIDDSKVEEVTEAVDQFEENVKGLLEEELEVSEEDIERAMEELGLTFLDLTDVNNLANLVTELTGAEDSISLVVNEDFNTILNQVKDFTQDMVKTVDLPVNVITDVVDNVVDNAENNLQMQDINSELVNELEVTPQEDVITLSNSQTDNSDIKIAINVATGEEIQGDLEPEIMEEVEISAKPEYTTVVETNSKTEDDEPEIETNVETVIKDATTENVDVLENRQQGSNTNSNNSQREMTHTEREFNPAVSQDIQSNGVYEPESAQVTLPDGQRVYVREIIDQIVTQVRTTITSETKTMEMILNPEGLGKIYMEVSEKQGNVTAKLYTENQIVKEALESQIVALKEQLNNTNTKVTSVEISVATHEFERNLEEGQQDRQQEEQNNKPRTRNINLNNLDELSGLMTEEEELVAQIMRDNGNTVNLEA